MHRLVLAKYAPVNVDPQRLHRQESLPFRESSIPPQSHV